MPLTYEQLTEILLQAGKPFTIQERLPSGKTNIYRGRDAQAFLEYRDGRMHEHKAFDPEGNLLYHRDVNGKLYVGSPKQWRAYAGRQQAGRAALSGMDIFRQGVGIVKRRWLG